MDKKRSIINIAVSLAFKVILLIGNLLVRRFVIRYLGIDINGLNSLFLSIIGFVSVAELGIGAAITFCMYKPIVDGDNDKVAALYCLFKKLYLIIGGIILAVGCLIMPALPYLAKGYDAGSVNIYLTYFLMLASVVLSYCYSAKISLINAYKDNYITTIINSGGQILEQAMQIAVLILTRSFVLYMVCRIIAVSIQWCATEIVTRKMHREIIKNKQRIDAETKGEVTKNVKAMFMHKIGGIMTNTVDSIIISAFIGVTILGEYTNYTTIMTAMVGTIVLFFSPLTAVIGHLYVEEDENTVRKYFNFFYTFNFILGCVFFLGYYSVIDDLVTICFGEGLEIAKSISFIITIDYFVQFIRQATLLFRDATGTFYYDRWKPLIESAVNVALSIGFVYLFKYLWGEEIAVVGVIVATIITNVLICHVVEPYVLHKHALHLPTKKFYIKNYACMLVFGATLVVLHFCMVNIDNHWLSLLANGGIAVAISIVPCIALALIDKDFRHYVKIYADKIKSRLRGKKAEAVAANDAAITQDDCADHIEKAEPCEQEEKSDP